MDAVQTTPHRPEENTRRKAITKLIEAVAEQQEALARILEAEHKNREGNPAIWHQRRRSGSRRRKRRADSRRCNKT